MKKLCTLMGCLLMGMLAKAQPWQAYADSATTAERAGKIADAIHYLELAHKQLPNDSINSMSDVVLLRRLGEQHLRLSQFPAASRYLQSAFEIFEKKNVTLHPQYAILCDRFGRVLEATDPAKAEAYYATALDITATLFTDSSIAYAGACNSLANFYYNAALYGKAEKMHLVAKKIKERLLGKDDPDYARTCNNLGAVYEAMGDFEKAEPLVLEAKRIRALIPPVKAHPVYAITCANLANIYTALGQYDKAEVLYQEARSIRAGMEPKGLHADYAASCNRLADFYYLTKAFDKASALYEEALTLRAKQAGAQSLDYAESCNNLATLYCDMGRYDEAEKLALQAKAIWDLKAPAESPDHAINRNNLGLLYYAMGKHDQALPYLMEARQVWAKSLGNLHPFYAANAASIAKLYWAMGQPARANEFFEEALQVHSIQVEKVFRFMSEKEKQAYIMNSNNFTDEYLSFCFQQGFEQYGAVVLERLLLNRNLILTSLLRVRAGIYASEDSLLQQQYESWIKTKKQLAQLYSAVNLIDSTHLNALEETANDAEKMLTKNAVAFRQSSKLPGWKQLQQQLGEDEAAIEFASFKYYNGKAWTDSVLYLAVLLRKDLAAPVVIPLFEQKQLDSVWGNKTAELPIRRLYTRGVSGQKLLSKTASFYPLMWKPIEKHLKGISKIHFAPAGDLYKISFAAMALNDKQVLSDVYELQQLNSTALLGEAAGNVLTVTDSLFLYGGIRYQLVGTPPSAESKWTAAIQYAYLPGTLAEVDSVKAAAKRAGFFARRLTGMQAVEESIHSLNDHKSPAVLHIATHGFFDQKILPQAHQRWQGTALKDPLLSSGLLFAGAQDRLNGKLLSSGEDGILTALEISNLHLPNTRLVVLSACQTALGAVQGQEGVYGLQRAFKIAGAQYLLMSLWEVGDWETARFMKIFYDELLKKQPIEKAFAVAQQKMKTIYRDAPEKWAAWILVR